MHQPHHHLRNQDRRSRNRRDFEPPQDIRFPIHHRAHPGAEKSRTENADRQHHRHDLYNRAALLGMKSLREDERPERCLQLWTLKEAYIKARGMGLALPLNNFSFLFGGSQGIRMALDSSVGDEPGRWRFCLLQHAGHCIAMMVESRTAPALQLWDARLPIMTPRRITGVKQQWFPRS